MYFVEYRVLSRKIYEEKYPNTANQKNAKHYILNGLSGHSSYRDEERDMRPAALLGSIKVTLERLLEEETITEAFPQLKKESYQTNQQRGQAQNRRSIGIGDFVRQKLDREMSKIGKTEIGQ